MVRKLGIAVVLAATSIGAAAPVYANDPASDYARSVCLNNGWRNLSFETYLECYRYYYMIYGTPDQPDDPYNP